MTYSNKHAYLILAHDQWDVLISLLTMLDNERNDIYLHIDKKVKHFPKDKLSAVLKKSKLYFTKRYDIVWGGTQMMKCVINMLSEAHINKYEYYHLLSGADLPLKNSETILSFFDNNLGKQYIGFNWIGIESGQFLNRIKYYHFFKDITGKRTKNTIIYKLLYKLEDYSLALQSKLKIDRQKNNKDKMYKGSMWFSITHKLASSIIISKKILFKNIGLQQYATKFGYKRLL